MARMTHAQKDAKIAMLESTVYQQQQDALVQRREIQRLRDQLEVHSRVPQLSFQQLSERAKALAAQGVPCKIFHGHIIHSITKAVLL